MNQFEQRLRACEAWEPDGNRLVVCHMAYGYFDEDTGTIAEQDKLFFSPSGPDQHKNGTAVRLATREAVEKHALRENPTWAGLTDWKVRAFVTKRRLKAPSCLPSEDYDVNVWGYMLERV